MQIGNVDNWLASWKRQPETEAAHASGPEAVFRYFVSAGASYYLVFDYSANTTVYVSKNIEQMTGYDAQDWIGNSLEMFAGYVHPADKKRLLELTSEVSAYFSTLSLEKRLHTWGSYSFRFRRANGSYMHLLRQDIVLQLDPQGNPRLAVWFGSDISHLKSDNRVVATITDVDEDGQQSIRELTASHVPDPTDSPRLSIREQEIIRLLAQGLSSKQIAQQLNLSFHTVTTHKRNIFEKTCSHNAHALVGFAHRNGII